jgi:hypothetical protein
MIERGPSMAQSSRPERAKRDNEKVSPPPARFLAAKELTQAASVPTKLQASLQLSPAQLYPLSPGRTSRLRSTTSSHALEATTIP